MAGGDRILSWRSSVLQKILHHRAQEILGLMTTTSAWNLAPGPQVGFCTALADVHLAELKLQDCHWQELSSGMPHSIRMSKSRMYYLPQDCRQALWWVGLQTVLNPKSHMVSSYKQRGNGCVCPLAWSTRGKTQYATLVNIHWLPQALICQEICVLPWVKTAAGERVTHPVPTGILAWCSREVFEKVHYTQYCKGKSFD